MAEPIDEFAEDADPVIIQTSTSPEVGHVWTWAPLCSRPCAFGPEDFSAVMDNLIYNPNQLSSWLFRADIVYESGKDMGSVSPAPLPVFAGFKLARERVIVRRMIPRNTLRDKPMLQTCLFYESAEAHDVDDTDSTSHIGSGDEPVRSSLVIYLPHVDCAAEMPFYHPMVQGVAFLHQWQSMASTGTLSMHFSFFPPAAIQPGLEKKGSHAILARVALNLLNTVHKHGHGKASGYVKRVHHDRLVTQARVQDRYTYLKEKHARRLVDSWQETTDPAKHVFEDLAISAFLMELWADMYGDDSTDDTTTAATATVPAKFPGFVDIGCGNGLLVHLLNEEGYHGWGFDARQRRSWKQYGNDGKITTDAELPLQQALLLPTFLIKHDKDAPVDDVLATHNGTFPRGTFIIANHADELTAWAPVLAALSDCPFLAIPCCSHNFTGGKFRAPPPSAEKQAFLSAVSLDASSSSTYASFVSWVMDVAEDCSWEVEREMLRIPSTRNVGLLGRRRRRVSDRDSRPFTVDQAWEVINKYGGAYGFADNVAKLSVEGKQASH
ncbi:duf1613 domain containing protein [Grosmannia clavigera kw1407]|uniref:tRNA (uracil-O(2)-)-methyltransferase n=1 Tax=Grosmannia clavigera (strain kw1407 / UAMH 11150) TaxID=655863 RepID=F0XGF4_GROCL|nr:duf1613 domain containing protein [Grosmannia clavigera kw1407]EFX03196.1 duf1613 domain containing protein [Grosmannia clavigera kw1407]